MIAAHYAKALYDLGDRATMGRVREALVRRGHIKLLPRIYAEYQKLLLRERRAAAYRAGSPAKEQTRVLVELYKKLVATR